MISKRKVVAVRDLRICAVRGRTARETHSLTCSSGGGKSKVVAVQDLRICAVRGRTARKHILFRAVATVVIGSDSSKNICVFVLFGVEKQENAFFLVQ